MPFQQSILAVLAATLPALVQAQAHQHGDTNAPYAGFEAREVSSLSDTDLEELRKGGGWGLALPAELNGRPGPLHLLDLRDQLALTDAQASALAAMVAEMRADAIAAGETFIAAEAALDAGLQDPALSEDDLGQLVQAAARARADLRLVHLRQHLRTPALLTPHQIALYATLRGYAPDPCAATPDGHDPAMWQRHNGCD